MIISGKCLEVANIMNSGKQWSGLVSAYYIPRWKAYFKALEKAVLTGSKFDKDQFRYFLKIWHINKLR